MAIDFHQHRPGTGVGSESAVPVSADDPLPVTVVSSTVPAANGTTAPPVTAQPGATNVGGVPNNFRLVSSANSLNQTLISGQLRQLYYIAARNTSASADVYLKLYNKATAPVAGTDTPVMTIVIPFSGGVFVPITIGVALFPLGIGFALTGGAADNDVTVIAAGQITGLNIGYA